MGFSRSQSVFHILQRTSVSDRKSPERRDGQRQGRKSESGQLKKSVDPSESSEGSSIADNDKEESMYTLNTVIVAICIYKEIRLFILHDHVLPRHSSTYIYVSKLQVDITLCLEIPGHREPQSYLREQRGPVPLGEQSWPPLTHQTLLPLLTLSIRRQWQCLIWR